MATVISSDREGAAGSDVSIPFLGSPPLVTLPEESPPPGIPSLPPLHQAVLEGDIAAVRRILEQPGNDVNCLGPDGRTALCLAMEEQGEEESDADEECEDMYKAQEMLKQEDERYIMQHEDDDNEGQIEDGDQVKYEDQNELDDNQIKDDDEEEEVEEEEVEEEEGKEEEEHGDQIKNGNDGHNIKDKEGGKVENDNEDEATDEDEVKKQEEEGQDDNLYKEHTSVIYWSSYVIQGLEEESSERRQKMKDMVQLLLQYGADPNLAGYTQTPPLIKVVQAGDLDLAELLVDHGADINIREGYSDDTPLSVAMETGDIHVAEWLLGKGADVNHRDQDGLTYLHHTVADDDLEFMTLLLNNGADLERTDALGCTPIFNVKSMDTLELLLSRGASVSVTDHMGYNLLVHMGLLVNEVWFLEAVKMVETKGCSLPAAINNLLVNGIRVLACATGVENIKLVTGSTEQLPSEGIYQVLHQCVIPGPNDTADDDVIGFQLRLEVLDLILNKGILINYADRHMDTVLHSVCNEGYDRWIPVLVERGADLCAANAFGATPLHMATKHSSALASILECHRQSNITLDFQDRFGSTALHWAACLGQQESWNLLVTDSGTAEIKDFLGRTPRQLPLASVLEHAGHDSDAAKKPKTACSGHSSILRHCPLLEVGDEIAGTYEYHRQWENHVNEHREDVKTFADLVLRSTRMGLLLDVADNDEIVRSIMEYLSDISKGMATENPVFSATLELTGSNREGTKAIAMDELDVMFKLDQLKDKFEPVESPDFPHGYAKFRLLDKHRTSRISEYINPDGFLEGHKVVVNFYRLFNKVVQSKEASIKHPHLVLNSTTYDWHLEGISSCSFFWFSADYKGLKINVDIVPGLQLDGWVPQCFKRSSRLHTSLPGEVFAVLKSADDVKEPGSLFRVSVSNLEVKVMKNIPESIRKAYILLKALTGGPFYLQDESLTSYFLKQCFFHCVNQVLETLESTLDTCDHEQLEKAADPSSELPPPEVKAADPTNELPPPVAWARRVCDYMKMSLQDRQLTSFFIPDIELLGHREQPALVYEALYHLLDLVKNS